MLPERFWVRKCHLSRKISFVKKNFICKDKSGTNTKVKLCSYENQELYFGTLVLASYCYCQDNARNTDFFQNTGFKESSNIALEKISV